MRAIIIDDEVLNTKLLSKFLKSYCPDIEILGNANTVESGLELISQIQPQILFLDIEIHDKNARDVLQLINTDTIRVILITAYESYAVEMIGYNISGYVLKPIDILKLVEAVNKAKQEIEKLEKLEKESQELSPEFISISDKQNNFIIHIDHIIHLEADGNYSRIYTHENKIHVNAKPISYYEKLLPKNKFLRVHQSHIVNLNYISKYIRTKNGSFIMKNNNEIPISANKKVEVAKRIIL